MAARFVDELAQCILGMAELVNQPLIGLGFLDRVQVLALNVFEDCHLERFSVVELSNDNRNFVQACPLRRAPAALSGHDLVAMSVRAHDDRLDESARTDRGGKLVERCFVEVAPRLMRVRLQAPDGEHLESVASGLARQRRFLRYFAQKRRKAAAKARGPAA